ncbi:hypothetical protein Q7C_1562 [Methylophaga frappieri]|uniref:Uncharacterized protein n=1 Tax=Methylophaga frappieri (strain ATCC BAA-2434 / DSM 25690 / JAM7) TaxID=754477 RepID=I1YIG8_METFJ|nr:hypothetical protein [Methylophaga frappieri]AFJ02711.1 hypothetical protein Q7C_1562 [Methylophaga frappieri]
MDRQAAGDAYGMARAAKSRLNLVEQLDSNTLEQNTHRFDLKSDQRRSAILASARDMVEAANRMAADDEDTLRRIEQLSPLTPATQPSLLGGFAGIIGSLREVKMTIGLEVQATLSPAEKDSIRLPVDGSQGTTIYAQPAGHQHLETAAKITMNISRYAQNEESWKSVICPETTAARLPCFVPPGDHSEIEINLQNNGDSGIDVLVFISGNAKTVATSMERQQANQPNRLGDE